MKQLASDGRPRPCGGEPAGNLVSAGSPGSSSGTERVGGISTTVDALLTPLDADFALGRS